MKKEEMNSQTTVSPVIPERKIEIPNPDELPSLKGMVSDDEWRMRCELAALYRLVALYKWDDLIFTHISLRLPSEAGAKGARFLLNPYGVSFSEMTASALVVVDLNGDIIGDTPYFHNPAGFTIHSAIHHARADAHCVLHLHSQFGVAVSAQERGLLPISQFSMIVHDEVRYHDYEGIAVDLGERERLVRALGASNFLILRNHGVLTTGENCALSFLRMYFLEQACKCQILAQSGGALLRECNAELASKVYKQGLSGFAPKVGDAITWPTLIRRLNIENPGYDR